MRGLAVVIIVFLQAMLVGGYWWQYADTLCNGELLMLEVNGVRLHHGKPAPELAIARIPSETYAAAPDSIYRNNTVYVIPMMRDSYVEKVAAVSRTRPERGPFFKGVFDRTMKYGVETVRNDSLFNDVARDHGLRADYSKIAHYALEARVGKDGTFLMTGCYESFDFCLRAETDTVNDRLIAVFDNRSPFSQWIAAPEPDTPTEFEVQRFGNRIRLFPILYADFSIRQHIKPGDRVITNWDERPRCGNYGTLEIPPRSVLRVTCPEPLSSILARWRQEPEYTIYLYYSVDPVDPENIRNAHKVIVNSTLIFPLNPLLDKLMK